MKYLLFLEDIVGSPCKLMSKDAQRLGLAMLSLQFCPVFYSLRVSPEERTAASEKAHFR